CLPRYKQVRLQRCAAARPSRGYSFLLLNRTVPVRIKQIRLRLILVQSPDPAHRDKSHHDDQDHK
ncbi:MAG: hypothetical protein KGI54_18715, partial [Pseudomonadota bacterium]|nr:hypothetical protein [Pseudomonadota bacterium]MDE3023854.1 hypothetical protein [Pseudomonadota bacterium]